MPAGQKLGFDCYVYRNTASWESPTWIVLNVVKDVTLEVSDAEVTTGTRASVFEMALAGMTQAGLTMEVVHAPSDAGFLALRSAKTGRTAIELLVLDGEVTEAGSHGLRANCVVLGWTRNEPLNEELTYSVTVKPTPSANDPTWYTVAAGS